MDMQTQFGKKMKVARGTARKGRRLSMDVFRSEQSAKRAAIANAVTVTYTTFGTRAAHRELNPHLHDVATVTDLRNGYFVVNRYESSPAFPANVVAPRRKFLFRYALMSQGQAISTADRVNSIEVR